MTRPQAGQSTLTPELVLAAYAQGAFPMARSRGDRAIYWFSPDPRAILPLDGFHCPRTVRRHLRQARYDIRVDTAFAQVVDGCAAPRPRGEVETWINDDIRAVFCRLHAMGLAHSVETWRDARLVGGLYGLALGAAFFGESMFHAPDQGADASSVALAATVAHLRSRGFELFDVQFSSEHLERFGVVEIPREAYRVRLADALAAPCRWK